MSFSSYHCPLSCRNSSGWECRVPLPVCGVTEDAEMPTKEEVAVCSPPKRAPRPVAQITFNLELTTRSSFCFSGQSNTSPPWQSQLEQKGTVRQLRPIWRNQISLCLCFLSPHHHLCWTLKPHELSVNSELFWNYSVAHQPCTRWLYGDEASRQHPWLVEHTFQ